MEGKAVERELPQGQNCEEANGAGLPLIDLRLSSERVGEQHTSSEHSLYCEASVRDGVIREFEWESEQFWCHNCDPSSGILHAD